MRSLGLLIGLIFLLAKAMGKKRVETKTKKPSPEFDDDFYASEEESSKSRFQSHDINSDVKKSENKEAHKKSREDRGKKNSSLTVPSEISISEDSSQLFQNTKDIKKELVKSIIYSEVIGRPKSLRK